MHYPDDAISQTIGTQVLLGSDLMIAPALSPTQTTVTVHLPPDHFVDVWTGKMYGSSTIATAITLPTVPGVPNLLARVESNIVATLVHGVGSLPVNTC